MTSIAFPIAFVTGAGSLLGLILAVVAKFMHVPVDQLAEDIREALPGANCGACGYAGCNEYAEVLASKKEKAVNLCTPGGAQVVADVSALLGVEAQDVVPMTAVVHCGGTKNHTSVAMEYSGPPTCADCVTFYNGDGSCAYGCVGYGDCVTACIYDAIYLQNGIPVIDKTRCTGCSMCATTCPKSIISIEPTDSEVHVTCSSHDRGITIRQVCEVGCTGCMRCVKVCEFDAISVVDFLASVDTEKCTNCYKCVEECPQDCIEIIKVPEVLSVEA